MKFFTELGSLIERRWRECNYSEEAFPRLAEQALQEMPPHKNVDAWDTIRWLLTATDIPQQQDVPGKFGNPPITLYSGPRFHIDIYFWLDGTTSIHQHAFCGAFHVLMGSSIHSHYSFHPQQFLNEHFAVGEMVLEKVELLEQGQTQRISPGKAYIHSLFHLDRPSATICVRTYHTTTESPQYNYLKPYFANDPFYQDVLTTKQLQSVSLLLRMPHPQAVEMLDDLLSRADFQMTFNLLDMAWGHFNHNTLENTFGLATGKEQYQRLFETARRRHGQLVDLIPPVFEEVRRQNNVIHRRGQITSPEHRFFLALLLNVPDRQRMLDMVRQKFPASDPVDTVMEWMEELALTKVWGSSEPNVLGIADCDDDYLFVLRCLLEGKSKAETSQLYATELGEEFTTTLSEKVAELYQSITTSSLFSSLFSQRNALAA
ncbi:MAG: hypothetical protein JST84_02755 [Acidobacteria bacterium]|nr:hypothetical protein [Acidobacteriota bacterium]